MKIIIFIGLIALVISVTYNTKMFFKQRGYAEKEAFYSIFKYGCTPKSNLFPSFYKEVKFISKDATSIDMCAMEVVDSSEKICDRFIKHDVTDDPGVNYELISINNQIVDFRCNMGKNDIKFRNFSK